MTELFTKWENHKYKDQAETSIISKSILFKLINSYFSIVYVTFFQSNSTFETIFYLLVPILLVNQITYIALSILLPLFKYKNQEKSYFTSVKNMYRKFEANFSSKFSFLTNAASQQIKQDQIEQFWKLQFKKEMESKRTRDCAHTQLAPGPCVCSGFFEFIYAFFRYNIRVPLHPLTL